MQIVEIDKSGISVSVSKGFIVVSEGDATQTTPLDCVDCLILNSYGAQLSNQLLIRLAEHNIPLIICGNNSLPTGMLLSCSQNVYRKTRIETQVAISQPLRKQLWQNVVKAKLQNQASLLKFLAKPYKDIDLMISKVRSGDSGNLEAVAARRYWPRLLGKGFKRDPDAPGPNAFLNYGYAILRAAVCRAVVGAGLLPEMGIHHRNLMDPFCLGDDLMEPYRPYVDAVVARINPHPEACLTPVLKRELVALLDLQVSFRTQQAHLRDSVTTMVNLFVESLCQKRPLLEYPLLISC